MHLTKTDFLLFLEAPMHLWAKAHDQLEIKWHTPYEQHLIQQGQQVEALARDYLEKHWLPCHPGQQLLWQPTYDDGQFEIRADALIFDAIASAYDLYEIKSSTSVKKDHELDLAFQVLLLESILSLRGIHILHINRSYQDNGSFDPEGFFTIEECSAEVEKRRDNVAKWRQIAREVLYLDQPPGLELACTKPDSCPCPGLCHPDLPENPIYHIPYFGKKALALRQEGIRDMKDIPASAALNEKQRRHVRAAQQGKPQMDIPAIRAALAGLTYPLNFLDYETFNPAVPIFPGYHPYEHIVFQYSLHVVDSPEEPARHFDCLITHKQDPAPLIVPQLLKHIRKSGAVIVWNQSFEAGRNKDLTDHCPEYAHDLLDINSRLFDLMRIFKDGHYVDARFHGSASLKAVLPVLCPELDYNALEISQGEEAMLTWWRLQQAEMTPEEQAKIETDLRAYCERDTYAMVAIFNLLETLITGEHEQWKLER